MRLDIRIGERRIIGNISLISHVDRSLARMIRLTLLYDRKNVERETGRRRLEIHVPDPDESRDVDRRVLFDRTFNTEDQGYVHQS